MDVQAAPPPFAGMTPGRTLTGNPPVLGQQVPGMAGGLPPQGGLAVTQNPMARELQSYGRGDDSMLVHMTPAEVNSLQGLALATGGSLTINPHTGLPEAGWLGKLLPTLLGFGLNFIPGIGPLAAAGITAAGATAVTGDLKKGLLAGLQAYGGAGISGAVAPGATASGAVTKLGTEAAAKMAAEKAAVTAAQQGVTAAGTDVAAKAVAQKALDEALKNQVTKMPGLLDKFGTATSLGAKGLIGKALPMVAGTAVLGGVSDAMQPKMPTYKPEEPGLKYTPMAPLQRKVRFQTPEQMEASGGAEYQYYTPVNPEPVPLSMLPAEEQQKYRYADGGPVMTPTQGFNDLVASYSANNPGAITASMKYPATAPAPAAEQKYSFGPATPLPAVPTSSTGLGSLDPSNLNIGNYDFSNISIPGFDWEAVRGNLGINQIQQQLQQQNAQSPILNIEAPDLSGIYDRFGALESKLNAMPTQQPTYEAPDLSGLYSRFDALESRFNSMPTYQAPTDVRSNVYEALDGFARGGGVNMRDGAFVVDARTVSELGNGSSNAGMELLSRMGGKPVRGPGDGVSDSVPAKIGGKQKARVARDEVIFQPDAVRRIGGGSEKRGTQKLYALMDKAHKARKKAKRGQDTGVRRGLA